MAWSAPKTWSSGYVVLAADMNNIRDQLNATAPATLTAQGDIVIASGANALARLAKSTTSTQYLANTGSSNAPAWNEVALDTGVSGTLPVGNGGTGATTLIANGAIIGNGSSALTSVDMSTKGGLLAGDGSGNPSVLAVGTNDYVLTADSGETTGVKWAVVTATTLISNLDIDGATDIGAPIDDDDLFIIDDGAGGTNRKTAASRIKTYVGAVPSEADKGEIEDEDTGTLYAPPDLIKHSPGVAKVWVRWEQAGTHSIQVSYNMTSVTDGSAVGDTDHVFDVDFATNQYVMSGGADAGAFIYIGAKAAGTLTTITILNTGSATDSGDCMMSIHGTQ